MSEPIVLCALNWPSRHHSSYHCYYRTYPSGMSGGGSMWLCSVGLCLLWVFARLDYIFCVAILAQMMGGYCLGWVLASMGASNWQVLLRLRSRCLVHLGYCRLLVIGACRRVLSAMLPMKPRKSRTAWLMVLLLFLCGSEVSCPRNGGGVARQGKFVLPLSSPTRRGGEPITGGRASSWKLLPTRTSQS